VHSRALMICCFLSVLCAGCSTSGAPVSVASPHVPLATPISNTAQSRETILLVSLDDGQVIMQRISSTADICFKNISDSATTCLVQGAPIIDPVTNEVIGIEMIEEHIDLVGKTD